MALLVFKIKKTGTVTRTLWNRAVKEALAEAGALWHGEMMPKHFTESGARLYRYDRRSAKYTKRKRQLFGHGLPLVFSGATRTLASIRDIRSTSKRTRVVINAPTLNRIPRGKRKTMREEMTTITTAERKRLVKRIDRSLQTSLNKISRAAR